VPKVMEPNVSQIGSCEGRPKSFSNSSFTHLLAVGPRKMHCLSTLDYTAIKSST
jgi:hypothetical protein